MGRSQDRKAPSRPLKSGAQAAARCVSLSVTSPARIEGLCALEFRHGAAANGPIDTLFFTAGPIHESDGLFGTISAA